MDLWLLVSIHICASGTKGPCCSHLKVVWYISERCVFVVFTLLTHESLSLKSRMQVLAFADDVFQAPSISSNNSSTTISARRRKNNDKKTVLIKLFKGRDEEEFLMHARARYNEVRLLKPKASRSESGEQYLLARGFKGVGGGGNEGGGEV